MAAGNPTVSVAVEVEKERGRQVGGMNRVLNWVTKKGVNESPNTMSFWTFEVGEKLYKWNFKIYYSFT